MYEEIKEEWRDVVGYEGIYQVSTTGKVRNIVKNFELKQSDCSGYKKVSLMKGKKCITKLVHILVAQAFIPNPENKPQIDHIDGTRNNNNAINLRWVTTRENTLNPVTFKRGVKKLREICCNPEDEISNISEDIQKSRLSFKNAWERSKRKVRNIETGLIWPSCASLAKFLQVCDSMVTHYCKGDMQCGKTVVFENGSIVHKPTFEYVEESHVKRGLNKNNPSPFRKKVKCIENGITWSSISHASKDLHISESLISSYCKGAFNCSKTVTFSDGTTIVHPHFEFVNKEKENENV